MTPRWTMSRWSMWKMETWIPTQTRWTAGILPLPLSPSTDPSSWFIGVFCRVIFTKGGIPHIYASNRDDLQRVFGYVVARDRYFTMDLARRLEEYLVNLVGKRDSILTRVNSTEFPMWRMRYSTTRHSDEGMGRVLLRRNQCLCCRRGD